MKTSTTIVLLSLFAASSSLHAILDHFEEIAPSEKAEGYHTKLKFKKQGDGKLLLTLPKLEARPSHQAWLVVCKTARGEGRRNFRYEVHWPESKANKSDIEMVIPVKFEKNGISHIQLSDDLASRSYIVFGGNFDDGTFYTVDLPAFRKALDKLSEDVADQPGSKGSSE